MKVSPRWIFWIEVFLFSDLHNWWIILVDFVIVNYPSILIFLNSPDFTMVYFSFNILPDSICWHFIEYLCIFIHKWDDL